ncbi:interleukin-27 receptor subunit alpha [Tiliqua scincoides]|uniref:interleukin-27 receptor subunit alpha n=1 Tax=Tiliqua scincoides TaxID=71010 RepID=UPI003462239F
MRSRWNSAWLLLLALKAFGLKEGDPDASMGLHCYQMVPNHFMNCSWISRAPPSVNITYVFYYQSLKYHRGQTRTAKPQSERNWLVIERSKLTQGEIYSVWLEAHSATGTTTSDKLNFNLDDIVKPPPPDLDLGELQSSEVTVKWSNPTWSESLGHQPLIYALRYKTSKDHDWTYLNMDSVYEESHDLEDLKPFTSYEVQARCIPHQSGSWSEWSSSHTFVTLEAAPQGQVDVWRRIGGSETREQILLLWKALGPEAAQGTIINYEVSFRDSRQNSVKHKMCLCCNTTLPHTANYVWLSAHNSVSKTQPANLSLEQTDLPGPQEVMVQVAQGLGFNVTWKSMASPLGVQPQEYVVEWSEELFRNKLNWTRRPSGSSSALLQGNFTPKIPYLVHVYALYAEGSSASVAVRAYFQEEVPSGSPKALQVRSISSTASVISWEEIPLASRNGHVTHYTIYLQDSTSRTLKTYGPIGATERSYYLSGLNPGIQYLLWMTGSTSAGEGVRSTLHHFHIPDSHWQFVLIILLVLGLLVILALIVVFVKRNWFFSFCRKVLPQWCWEKIPDPEHSGVVLKINDQTTVPDMDALSKTKAIEEPIIVEIKEPAPPEPAPPITINISGYEKRFMPTLEELQKLT